MSPRSHRQPISPAAAQALNRMAIDAGTTVRDERSRRRWSLAQLGRRAGISTSHLQGLEAGEPASLETYARVMTTLGLRPALVAEGRAMKTAGQDRVHASMGELQAALLQQRGYPVAIDEPYQHYQFAGRADVVAWDLEARALLHIENRTRFPDLQNALGSYNAKRAYLGRVLAERLGIRGGWLSETHAMAALWTSEVLHAIRMHRATFRAACPDSPGGIRAWLRGEVPALRGVTSALVLFDPGPGIRDPFRLAEPTGSTRPRYRGYAEVAEALRLG